MFDQLGADWLTYVLTFLLVTGLMASLIQILGGPSRGLLVAGKVGGNHRLCSSGRMPRARMPVAIIPPRRRSAPCWRWVTDCWGSVQNAWFVFAIIQTNMTLIMYILMLAAVVRLRLATAGPAGPYRDSRGLGRRLGRGRIGIITCFAALLVSASPTEEAQGMSAGVYIAVVLLGTLVFAGITAVPRSSANRRGRWKTKRRPVTA